MCILASEKYNACNCNLIFMAMSLTRKSHFIFLLSCPWSWLWLLCSSVLLMPAVPKPMAFPVQTTALRSLLQLYPWHMVSCYKNFYTFLLLNSFSWLKHTHFLRFLLFTQLRKYSTCSQRVKMIIMFQNSNYFWYIPIS